MRRLILIAAMSALVIAKPKPETYKETEDFQYSRSSSDDGTKSGFYGAQRGNMGGNYERAHNMDSLAQHQMSGLVRQVDGELGEGVKTRTGSVYTAANSRGIYGSGKYDLSNLQGRNFAEGETAGNLQSHSSLLSQQSKYGGQAYSGIDSSAGFSNSHSQDARYSGYKNSHYADQSRIDNLQAVDASQGLGRYENNNQAGYDMKYHTQYGSQGRTELDQSSANFRSSGYDANSQAHYITTPVKIVMRPGGRVAIPITAPTYGVSQKVLSENNGLNSDAEVLNQHAGSTPTNKVKHYEASYSYRKQWEKHHAIPGDVSIIVPTENPFPKNSELYEDAQLLQSSKNKLHNSQSVHSDNINSDQRDYTRAASSQSRFQTGNSRQTQYGFDSQQNYAGFNTQQSQTDLRSLQSQSGLTSQQNQLGYNTQQKHSDFNSKSSVSSDSHANAYGLNAQNSGMAADLTNVAGDVNSKPKSYHSSYSYHKSWERQGDPYVIKPVGGVYDGQASERLTAGSSNSAAYSSHQYGSHSRQAHQSYSADCDDQGHIRVARSYNPNQELQQLQNQWEDLGQQTQSKLENLEDFGQQQHNQWDNLQDLGQQTQDQWDNLQQLGQQQTQDKWDKLEDLGQQTHRDLDQHQNDKLEDFSQQNQKEDALINFEQQVNNQNENLDVLSQHIQKENSSTGFEQQDYSQNENLEELSQHAQEEDAITNFEQQATNQNANLDILNQKQTNFEQQANSQNEELPSFNNWEQTLGFQSQTNEGTNNQHVQLVYKQNDAIHNLFAQNQQDVWYQSNTNVDRNFDSYGSMKPTSQWTDITDKKPVDEVEPKTVTEDDKPNLFPMSSSDSVQKNLWSQNKEQNIFWSYDQNTNDRYEHTFWNTNNFNTQDGHSIAPTSFPTSDIGHPLQTLWDKIDNIAGEITANKDNKDDKESQDSSNSYTQNQNSNYLHNEYSWHHTHGNPYVDLANTNSETESKEPNSEHHNLFDEEKESTTVLPISQHSSRPENNVITAIHIDNQKPIDANKRIHSQDEGRGDIEPEEIPSEITTVDKPNKTPQEIETLSLTKNTSNQMDGDVIIQANSNKNNGENTLQNTSTQSLVTNINQKENVNINGLNEPFHPVQSTSTTTMPNIEIMTTVKSVINVESYQPSNKPKLDVSDLQNQKPTNQITIENVELPEDVQQQNLEQQYQDFSQLQNSWFPTNNFQQGYSQQNLEQQFEDFQQHENIQDQISLQDFGQDIQSSLPSLREPQTRVEQSNPNQYYNTDNQGTSRNNDQQLQMIPVARDAVATPQISEPIQISHIIEDNSKGQNLVDNQGAENSKSSDIQSPVEISTEKPGFWKSVGSKFTNAKNKVYSWFSGS